LAAFLIRAEEAKSSMRALALASGGTPAKLAEDFQACAHLCGEALDVACSIGNHNVEAYTLHFLAHVAQERADYAEAEQLYLRSISLFQQEGNAWEHSEAMFSLGNLQRQTGHYAAAEITLRQALGLRRSFNNSHSLGATLCALGHVLLRQQDAARAAACFQESLEIGKGLDNQPLLCSCLCGLAGVAMNQNQPERAAQLLGAVDHFLAASRVNLAPPERADYEWIVAQTRRQAPDDLLANTWANAWAQGGRMSLAQAMAYALADFTG
jgi:tetratricopeptide (TPR) repeat protein